MFFKRFIALISWLLQPPKNLKHLWTYSGVWCLQGAVTGSLYHFILSKLLESRYGWWFAGIVAILVTTLLLKIMGFRVLAALLVSVGSMCIAIACWPTFHLELSEPVAIGFAIFGILISLPLFCRCMEELPSRR